MLSAAILGAATAVASVHLVVLGSGILPVLFAVLDGIAALAGGAVGLAVAVIIPARFRRLRFVATMFLSVLIVSVSFKRVVDRALLVAEEHARSIASLIERQVVATGQMPIDLGQVSGLEQIPPPPRPYLFYPALPPKIAGFFVGYAPGPPPRLWVMRRGYGAEYDWQRKKWTRVKPAA